MLHRSSAIALAAGLFAAAAAPAAEVWTLGITQEMQHSNNVALTPPGTEVADWVSTTGLDGRLNLPFGLQTLRGVAQVSAIRHRQQDTLNANPYRLGATLDWSAGSDSGLRGDVGAELARRTYIYDPTGARAAQERASQMSANVSLGLTPQWGLTAGLIGSRREFSETELSALDQRQWALEAGTRYQSSPDLSWRLLLRQTRGSYPDRLPGMADDYRRGDIEAGVQRAWAEGLSSEVVLGWGHEAHSLDGVADTRLVYGSADVVWRPTAKLRWQLRLDRNSDTGTRAAAPYSDPGLPSPTPAALSNAAVSTGLALGATWEVAAKVSLDGRLATVRRNLSATLAGVAASGSDVSQTLSLGVRYSPLPALDLSCRVQRERRTTDVGGTGLSYPYTVNTWGCGGQLWFGRT